MLDLRCRDRSRLVELLACEDLELIERLGGRRRDELRRAHEPARLVPDRARAPAICVHERAFPRRLRSPDSPRLLYTDGDPTLLGTGTDRPAVAVLGTTRPSAYGAEMARSLAHGLARGGITVVTLLTDGIARSARAGVQRAGAGAVVLSASGLEPNRTGAPRGTPQRTHTRGCRAAELPPGCHGRRWGRLAAERIAVRLSDVVLVVETEPGEEPFSVELARTAGGPVAAVPNRATAPLAQGPLRLLRDGATLVRCAEDVLELLGRPSARPPAGEARGRPLPRHLTRMLERVASGEETPEQLLSGADRSETLLALAQLELIGRVRRTGDGRYIATADGVTRG